jgi:hypothetical protein
VIASTATIGSPWIGGYSVDEEFVVEATQGVWIVVARTDDEFDTGATPDAPAIVARTERGFDVDLVGYAYLLTEAGDRVVTEAGELIVLPLQGVLEAPIVDAVLDNCIVMARKD